MHMICKYYTGFILWQTCMCSIRMYCTSVFYCPQIRGYKIQTKLKQIDPNNELFVWPNIKYDPQFRKYDPDWQAGNFDAWSWKLGEFNSMLTLLVVGTSFVMYFFTDSNFIRPRAMGKAISPTPTGSRKLFSCDKWISQLNLRVRSVSHVSHVTYPCHKLSSDEIKFVTYHTIMTK